MVLEFTLFSDDSFLGGGAHVCYGNIKEKGPIVYRLKSKTSECWLFDGQDKHHGRRTLLHGTLSHCKSHGNIGTIQGYNQSFQVKRSGFLSNKLSFVDVYTGRKYQWKVSFWGSDWELTDPEGNQVAYFDRSQFRMSRHGRLTVYQDQIPEHLMSLILLTHKILHNLVKKDEATAASAGS
jgi:hypothetical protein